MLSKVLDVALAEIRAVFSWPNKVVIADVRPLGSSPAACWVVTTLFSEDLGWEYSRVSVTIEVAVVGRGVLGGAITVGVEVVAWSVPSVAIVGVEAGTGVERVAWSVPSVAIVGVVPGTGVCKVAWSVPSGAMVGVLATTGVLSVA